MKAIYPVSILIISLIICYGFFRKQNITQKNTNKVIENFRNTTDFNDPSFKFFKALNDIKLSGGYIRMVSETIFFDIIVILLLIFLSNVILVINWRL